MKTLPSGHISDDVWMLVVHHRFWIPSKKDVMLVLMRGGAEGVRCCREMLRFVGLKVREQAPERMYCIKSIVDEVPSQQHCCVIFFSWLKCLACNARKMNNLFKEHVNRPTQAHIHTH